MIIMRMNTIMRMSTNMNTAMNTSIVTNTDMSMIIVPAMTTAAAADTIMVRAAGKNAEIP